MRRYRRRTTRAVWRFPRGSPVYFACNDRGMAAVPGPAAVWKVTCGYGISMPLASNAVFRRRRNSRRTVHCSSVRTLKRQRTMIAESDGEADDAGGAQNRRNRDAELAQDGHAAHQRDHGCCDVADHARDSLDTLDVGLPREPSSHPFAEQLQQPGSQALGHDRENDDHQHAHDRQRRPGPGRFEPRFRLLIKYLHGSWTPGAGIIPTNDGRWTPVALASWGFRVTAAVNSRADCRESV